MSENYVSAKQHYDTLIIEGNDPCYDSIELQKYMELWTGHKFIELLDITDSKIVLEIGIGTGRLAKKVLAKGCKKLVGLDISPLTIRRANRNLREYKNIELIETDITKYRSEENFDIAYSVLTFMHIKNKKQALKCIINSLKVGGNIILSLDSNSNNCIDYGNRKVYTFPSDVNEIIGYLDELGCLTMEIVESKYKNTKYATIIKAVKNKNISTEVTKTM